MMSSCNFSYQNAVLATTGVQHGRLNNSKTPSGCFTLTAHHMKNLQGFDPPVNVELITDTMNWCDREIAIR